MRKALGFLLPFLVLISLPAYGQEKLDSEWIQKYNTSIQINQDSSIYVSETILYNFGNAERHGIFRDIPVEYKTNDGGKITASISDISVTDENAKPYKYEVSRNGVYKRIKIGDGNINLTGEHTFNISYKATGAIGYFKDFDELYMNAPGTEWMVPILESKTTILLPVALPLGDLKISCYEGAFGSKDSCAAFNPLIEENAVRGVEFITGRKLEPKEGMSVAVGFPKGIVAESNQSKTRSLFRFLPLGIPILVFAVMFYEWFKRGRDPKGRGTIVPQYEAPENLSPVHMGALLKRHVLPKFISAEIVYLAEKGYLTIQRVEVDRLILPDKIDYILKKTKEADEALTLGSRKIFDGIFKTGEEIKISELKNKFYKELRGIRKAVFEELVVQGYYPEDPQATMIRYGAYGVFILLLGTVLTLAVNPALFILVCGISIVILIFFSAIMPKVTPKGAEMKEYILGLKDYLQIAEKDRLKFHNAPEKNPKIFEKLLPFAMALGVEKAWAKEFKDIYMEPPKWYGGPVGTFNAMSFSSDLSAFSAMAVTSFAAPGSSSGSGGGGFSGGGFGGGGGGSW